MLLAIIGAERAAERAALPQRPQKHKVYQHPNKVVSNPIPTLLIPKTVPVSIPMEIDAIAAKEGDRRNPFSAIRSICMKKGFCFQCIKLFDAETHMKNGERKCPNGNATLAKKLALFTSIDGKKTEEKIHQIAAVSFEDMVEVQDMIALE